VTLNDLERRIGRHFASNWLRTVIWVA